jgi:hypothetical protein
MVLIDKFGFGYSDGYRYSFVGACGSRWRLTCKGAETLVGKERWNVLGPFRDPPDAWMNVGP